MSKGFGPGYTVKDLVYWTGLIGGISVTYLALKDTEMHRFLKLLISLGVGVAAGVVAEYAYRVLTAPRPPRDDGPPSGPGGP
jgi:hypothetical protein